MRMPGRKSAVETLMLTDSKNNAAPVQRAEIVWVSVQVASA
jgi:hypothetical protein